MSERGKKYREAAPIPEKENARRPMAKRFYENVSAASQGESSAGFIVMLDGRRVRTPGKRTLALPTRALADAVAAEWSAQKEIINPETMPLTRLANTAIDGVTGNERAVSADIVAYGARDLLCYRAAGPQELVERQTICWDPLIRWAEETLGAQLVLAIGVMPVEQLHSALRALEEAVAAYSVFELTPLHVMTTLTGSALLALAVARNRLSPDEAWVAARLDEDWQVEQWGEDAEAKMRRERRRIEMEAAGRFLMLARDRA